MLTAYLTNLGGNPVAGGRDHPIHVTRSDDESLEDFHARVEATIVRLKSIPGNHDAVYSIRYEH